MKSTIIEMQNVSIAAISLNAALMFNTLIDEDP